MAVKIIAEIAQAHEGSLGRAHSFIDAVKCCGVDAIKYQTHIAEFESSDLEPWRIQFSYEDQSRYDYWKRMEFSSEQWKGLIEHAWSCGLEFIGTPFSVESLEMLHENGVKVWKLASGEVSNPFLVDKLLELKQPVIMSTGMSDWGEIDRAVSQFIDKGVELFLLQCTSQYPVPPERVGLNVMKELGEKYQVPVGLSDHSGRIFTSLAAVALGASLIEVHVTMSKYDFGPDVSSSLTIEELKELVEGIRFIERIINNPVQKDDIVNSFTEMREVFTKSLFAKRNIEKNSVISYETLGAKKPCVGVPVTALDSVIGKRAKREIAQGEFLLETDFY